MPRRVPLAAHLTGAAFRASDVEFHGHTLGRLRSDDVQQPFHGVRSVSVDLESVIGLCRAYESLLRPGEVFSHETASLLYGMPSFRVTITPVHVMSPRSIARARTSGVVGHTRNHPVAARLLHGLPVPPPAEVWCQLAATNFRDHLVAIGDFLLSGTRIRGSEDRTPALCSPGDLAEAVACHPRARGLSGARWALPRIRTGVDSPMESQLRLVLVAAGFREPVVGPPIPVDEGRVVLHPDLAWLDRMIVLEYEGEEHRIDRERFRSDIRRRELFEAEGYRVIRVVSHDLWAGRQAFLARVRNFL